MKTIRTAGGITTSYEYDEDGNISRLTIGNGTEEGLLYDAFMLYDLCGNRLLREQYSGSFVDVMEGYRYNERNQLTERIRAGIHTVYSYNKNGSIISEEEEGRRSEYQFGWPIKLVSDRI